MRVAIIGNGMAANRLARQLGEAGISVTVYGEEPHRAYNRVLLSEYIGGGHESSSLTLPSPPESHVAERRGERVSSVDLDSRTVHGRSFDKLVFATGAVPFVPPVSGLDPRGERVSLLRSYDDAEKVRELGRRSNSALVLGGGLLGLEAARGLSGQGLDVTVVHVGQHVLDRQVDPAGGAAIERTYADYGVSTVCGVVASSVVETDRSVDVRLEDGRTVSTDFMVVSCGVNPETTVADDAGLKVNRGIVVDDQCRTSNPDVYAVGDCAEHEGTVYGLVAPAWEQADVVARHILADPDEPRFTPPASILRLKAPGIDVAAMGRHHGGETVSFADPENNTYARLTVDDNRLVGAVLVGDNPSVGEVVELFDGGGPVPPDRRSLLLGRYHSPPSASGDDDAVICRCNNVARHEIRRACAEGARTVDEVASATAATTGCGTCRSEVAALCQSEPENAGIPV
ncbi:FAD-dependent oxidoreductase [Haloglycomyces albus]|uniref:FAD-dependent oxidoreductase n=1 Tax=Haloglycomyces albus TaxID=526067 RepID=UPI00046D42A9|nr:FAD-dependent oxidoreductase [Haloglycomyces albus]